MVATLLVAVLLVVAAVVALLVIPGPVRLRLRGPFRTGLDVDGDSVNGVQLDDVRSGRDLKASGPVVKGKRLDVGRDATFEAGGRGEGESPKG